jgi:hypothetical protein
MLSTSNEDTVRLKFQGLLVASDNENNQKMFLLEKYTLFCGNRGINASQSLLAPSTVRSGFPVPPLDKNALSQRSPRTSFEKGFRISG